MNEPTVGRRAFIGTAVAAALSGGCATTRNSTDLRNARFPASQAAQSSELNAARRAHFDSLSTPQIKATLDMFVQNRDVAGVAEVLNVLRGQPLCDRYVAALRHMKDSYGAHPDFGDVWLRYVGAETTARFGNKGPDLLQAYATVYPIGVDRLAGIIEKPTVDRVASAVLGSTVTTQVGFPQVAAEMRQLARSPSRR